MNFDDGNPYIFFMDSNMLEGFGVNYLSHLCSIVDFSLLNSNHLVSSGSIALQEAFCCISKFAGALFVWLSTGSNPSSGYKISRNLSRGSNVKNHKVCSQIKHIICTNKIKGHFFSGPDLQSSLPFVFSKFANSAARWLWKEFGQCQAFPVLSLAAAVIPPFENLSAKVLSNSIQLGMVGDQIGEYVVPQNKEEGHQVCDMCIIPGRTLSRDAIEPKTGISFPTVLDKPLAGEVTSANLTTEVLVGIGFRSLKILKFKSLKIYAFGLYVHFGSICKKLGHKYASVSAIDLRDCSDFYEDLLREDIGLTVRLVVNCNGLKINTVRDAFEKSLRTKLVKMNPSTDYECLRVFGSYFMEDIPLPIGTTIDFRRTTDGHLITEIGGKRIGAVQSKDLCRAFFDMYIGDFPVSLQAKQDTAENVARLMRRC